MTYYTEIVGSCPLDKPEGVDMVDLWDTESPAHGVNGTGYEEGLFKERLLSIVNSHDVAKPLFLYYAPHIVHTPLEVPEEYKEMFDFIDDLDRQLYHAMVTYLDDVVGDLVAALKAHQMWDNLLFV